jgi:3-hydroxyacyl-CoA dehydrogenase
MNMNLQRQDTPAANEHLDRESDVTFIVRRVAVLGAGVMGAQIAAHCANANVPVMLFDLPAKEGDKNGIVRKALEGLKKLEPTPLATKDVVNYIDAANYEQHIEQLRGCDLIIEAIAEKLEWKLDLYKKVAPYIGEKAIFATNTSGLSINKLAEACPPALRNRFCGVHFFNPPRYMPLVELIACKGTDAAVLDNLETFLTTTLGKSVVRAPDSPNFIGNRVGVFSLLAVMHHADRLGLGADLADALTGPLIGRPKSATYRTADIVGLDTLAHVVKTVDDALPDDPWHDYYKLPVWFTGLIQKGALGQKTAGGIYRKDGKTINVFDVKLGDYRATNGEVDAEVQAILKLKSPQEKFAKLRASPNPQAQFVWAIFRDIFHYCAYHLGDIADNARDVDLALRWGFGWGAGPFETWQAAGWTAIAQAIKEEVAAGKGMVKAELPGWVFDGREGVHTAHGSYSPAARTIKPRSALPVYRRQYFPERVIGETDDYGVTVFEDEGVRLWHTRDDKDIAIVSFKSKMNTLGKEVIDGLGQALDRAERDFKGLVVWQPSGPFSAGANLKAVDAGIKAGEFEQLEGYIALGQELVLRLKYALVPTVAAVQGLALGGGCELQMHCTRAVVAFESVIGLVEAGVGLIPGWGGCTELALRSAQAAASTQTGDLLNFLQPLHMNIAMGKSSRSAADARALGMLRDSDVVVMHPRELLHVAKEAARALAEAGYRPALPPRGVPVAGRPGIATLEMTLLNMRDGGMISEHDYKVSRASAVALCGGEVDGGTLVDERWLLKVERALFMELLMSEKSQQRIVYMLENGKPLRN